LPRHQSGHSGSFSSCQERSVELTLLNSSTWRRHSTRTSGEGTITSAEFSDAVVLTHPTRSHSSVRLVGWVSVGPRLERDRRINPTRNPPSSANLNPHGGLRVDQLSVFLKVPWPR